MFIKVFLYSVMDVLHQLDASLQYDVLLKTRTDIASSVPDVQRRSTKCPPSYL